jgi:hypothetical protein
MLRSRPKLRSKGVEEMSVITNCKSCGMEIFTNPPIKELECEKCEENRELKSLCLWSIRRVHKTYKEFAYDEYEKITGEKAERL